MDSDGMAATRAIIISHNILRSIMLQYLFDKRFYHQVTDGYQFFTFIILS